MIASDVWTVRWLLACLASLAAGGAVWAMTAFLRRRLPELASQRQVWLLAQLTVAGACCLVLLPQQQRVRLVPPVDIEAVADAVTGYVVQAGNGGLVHGGGAAQAASEAGGTSWLPLAGWLWLGVYLAGVVAMAVRLLHGWRLLERLAAGGARMPASPIPMIEVDAPVSPMLLGPWKPRLLLPRHLRELAPLQRELIVHHELTHWRRHDVHWMLAGLLLQTLFWFNPFMRLLRERLAWAQELGCDRDVLRGRGALERKTYAAALLAQLKLQWQPAVPVMAFGAAATPMAERIALIRTPVSAGWGWQTRGAAMATLAAAAMAGYVLQPALAWQPARAGVSAGALRCTALMDAASGQALVRQGQCDVRVTPVSTFNIAVSLMGYDSGVLQDEHTPKLPFRAGYADWIASWRAETDPTSWIRNSTVWYARQVTARLGQEAFQRYLTSFGYGNRDASGDAGAGNGLTHAWLNSSLQISPDEQLAFLRRLVNRDLGVKPRAYDMTGRLLKYATLPNGWEVYGKTGTGSPVLADGSDDEAHAYGWFVGWAVKGRRTVVFARLVQDEHLENDAAGPRVREAFLRSLPAQLDAL